MDNGCVSYIGEESPDLVMFYGNGFKTDRLPKGTRVIYPPKPIPGVKDPAKTIEFALENPLGSKPISHLLKKNMKVAIAFDDISLPLPPMKKPDLRSTAIRIILKKLRKVGVSDIHLISAICLHRKMTKKEFSIP